MGELTIMQLVFRDWQLRKQERMRILFVTAYPYLPQFHGGMQSDADALCRILKRQGHRVAMLAALMPAGFLGWKSRVKMQVNKRLAGCILAGIFAANTAEFPASVGATTGACHK